MDLWNSMGMLTRVRVNDKQSNPLISDCPHICWLITLCAHHSYLVCQARDPQSRRVLRCAAQYEILLRAYSNKLMHMLLFLKKLCLYGVLCRNEVPLKVWCPHFDIFQKYSNVFNLMILLRLCMLFFVITLNSSLKIYLKWIQLHKRRPHISLVSMFVHFYIFQKYSNVSLHDIPTCLHVVLCNITDLFAGDIVEVKKDAETKSSVQLYVLQLWLHRRAKIMSSHC
jgi:hypothetical protein